MKHILVTGGTGYIGSNTVFKLLINGYRVTIIDSNINSNRDIIKSIINLVKKFNPKYENNLTFIKGDLRDYSAINKIFFDSLENGIAINSVMHFAGLKSVAESKNDPLKYWEFNICGTINLLKNMNKFNCRNIIFSSSATVYGEKNKPPFKENCDLNPVSPYASSKVTIERVLEDIFNSNKDSWKITNLRYFNPIGAHSSGYLGDCPLGKTNNIFPAILEAITNNKKLFVFGNDWPTTDGTCIRDYIHVEDLAEGHIKALECQFLKTNNFDCFNLGTGKGTSVLELIKVFENVNNIKVPFEITSRREGDTAVLVADNALASDELDWKPKRSLRDMCKDGYKWFLKNPKGYY